MIIEIHICTSLFSNMAILFPITQDDCHFFVLVDFTNIWRFMIVDNCFGVTHTPLIYKGCCHLPFKLNLIFFIVLSKASCKERSRQMYHRQFRFVAMLCSIESKQHQNGWLWKTTNTQSTLYQCKKKFHYHYFYISLFLYTLSIVVHYPIELMDSVSFFIY